LPLKAEKLKEEDRMAEFLEIVKERRSIRNYSDQEVPEELLKQVFEAVRWAPSWANTQCCRLVVVKDPGTKQKLQQTLAKGNPATRAMVEAPVVIAVCGKLKCSGYYKEQASTKHGDWFMFDLGLATQNLCLAAHSMGLGTVVVGLFDHDQANQILQVPEGYEVVAMIPLGFPSRGTGAPKRMEIPEFVYMERFTG